MSAATIQLDPYQQQHSKYFNYQYIPPRLIERVEGAGAGGTGAGGTGATGGLPTMAYGLDDGMNASGYFSTSSLVWYIIIIIMLLSAFLLIGIMSVRGGFS
jgi:hypothetical protein